MTPEYAATSPNMDFIPRPPVGVIQVRLCKDFRYSIYDPLQWPQIYTPGYEYLTAVRRHETTGASWAALWWTPLPGIDFQLLGGSAFKCLGVLSADKLRPLRLLVEELTIEIGEHTKNVGHDNELQRLQREMHRALQRAMYFPSTLRDACIQIRQVQRFWLMARAFLDFAGIMKRPDDSGYRQVAKEYMGAFTTDPAHVQRLYHAGIPVWFLRPAVTLTSNISVVAMVLVREPETEYITTEPLVSGLTPIYSGLSGPRHLAAVSQSAFSYFDISESPLLLRDDLSDYRAQPASTQSASSSGRGAQTGAQRTSKKTAGKKPCEF